MVGRGAREEKLLSEPPRRSFFHLSPPNAALKPSLYITLALCLYTMILLYTHITASCMSFTSGPDVKTDLSLKFQSYP